MRGRRWRARECKPWPRARAVVRHGAWLRGHATAACSLPPACRPWAPPPTIAYSAAGSPQRLVERWLLPALAAVLPWRACFRVYRAAARASWPFRAETEAAHAAAARYLDPGDARATGAARIGWCASSTRPTTTCRATAATRWLDRHVLTRGAWPGRGEPFLALGYHWGAGLWALRSLRRAGHGAAFLSAEVDARQLGVGGVALRQARRRMRELERAGGLAPIYLGGASAAMQAVFAQGDVVVALIDVPPRAGPGHRARHPARARGAPARRPAAPGAARAGAAGAFRDGRGPGERAAPARHRRADRGRGGRRRGARGGGPLRPAARARVRGLAPVAAGRCLLRSLARRSGAVTSRASPARQERNP